MEWHLRLVSFRTNEVGPPVMRGHSLLFTVTMHRTPGFGLSPDSVPISHCMKQTEYSFRVLLRINNAHC